MLWEISTILLGILCLVYYIAICLVMGKWNSTFSRFWIAAGLGMIGIHFIRSLIVDVIVGVAFAFFIMIEICIIKAMFLKKINNLPYIIVLGAKVNGTVVSESLRRRLDAAAEYLRENPKTQVIVSGSQLGGELITEAEAMKAYLQKAGIEENRIFKEEASFTTEQNLKFSRELMEDKQSPVGIVTSNYHVFRALAYAKHLGYQNVVGIPASCHPVLFVNYMVREFFAIIKLFWLTKKFTML